MKPKAWEQLSSSLQHEASIFSVRKVRARSLLSGCEHDFDILECVDWVNVIAITEAGKVVLVRQYRLGTKELTLEIPGGQMNPGENPQEAAKRELAEETGYQADHWEQIGRVQPNPAFQTNTTYTFLASRAYPARDPQPDENEEIEVEEVLLEDVFRMISEGTMRHALVLCAFFFLVLRNELRWSGTQHPTPRRCTDRFVGGPVSSE